MCARDRAIESLAIGIIALLAMVHARGLGPARALQNALTLLKLGALVAFVGIGFASAGGGEIAPAIGGGPVPLAAFLFAMVP
jgi:amino acid transporter